MLSVYFRQNGVIINSLRSAGSVEMANEAALISIDVGKEQLNATSNRFTNKIIKEIKTRILFSNCFPENCVAEGDPKISRTFPSESIIRLTGVNGSSTELRLEKLPIDF